MSKPVRVRVRMYQVGFGDCFLVSVEYDEPLGDGRAERHILIDCGATHSPQKKGQAGGKVSTVAGLIKQHTGGVLDVIAVTHRHKDHLSAFGDKTAAAVLRELPPKRVLRSWTEDPELSSTADGPRGAALAGPGTTSARYAGLLSSSQDHVAALVGMVGFGQDARAAVKDQLKNADAVKLLKDLSEDGKGRYLYAGASAATGRIIPDLTITVLGPPTVEQDPRVAKQRGEDENEFWMAAVHASLRETAAGASVVDRPTLPPGPERWLVDRLVDHQGEHSATRLVRDLDDALNNTSLILLLEVGGLSLLFPGDAQIENWQYTLDRAKKQPALAKKLAGIDLYKVGHHGSRNATPKSLHALWLNRPKKPAFTALMSTRPGVHGESELTEVPRATLVEALQGLGALYSTDDLTKGERFIELVADAKGGPFVLVPPIPA